MHLLPEEKRRKFVDTVSKYALKGEDADALDDDGTRSFFTDDEFEELMNRVRIELLPRLADIRISWETNHTPGEPPEEYMHRLLGFFDSLKNRFDDDESAMKLVDRQIRRTREWIDENTPEEPERRPRKLASVEPSEKSQSTRSIFDDIDANSDTDNESL